MVFKEVFDLKLGGFFVKAIIISIDGELYLLWR